MSDPQPGESPSTRPLRLAGLVLLAVAAIAVAAGLISILIEGEDGDNAAPPTGTASATVGPSATSATEATDGTAPPGAPPGATTGAPGQPPPATATASAAPPAPQPPPAPPPPTAQPVRVYNNSTIQGLAAQAADDFTQAGWHVEEISNYPDGTIPTSTVYFRPGTDEEAAARALGNQFDMRVEPRFPGIEPASPGLIVIVTNDYGVK